MATEIKPTPRQVAGMFEQKISDCIELASMFHSEACKAQWVSEENNCICNADEVIAKLDAAADLMENTADLREAPDYDGVR